jgi:hypothetical protein
MPSEPKILWQYLFSPQILHHMVGYYSPVMFIGLNNAKTFHNIHALADPTKDCVLPCTQCPRHPTHELIFFGGNIRRFHLIKTYKTGKCWKTTPQNLQLAIEKWVCCFDLPSSQGVGASVRKNWLPLELGPEFAMDKMPAPVCFSSRVSSSSNFAL